MDDAYQELARELRIPSALAKVLAARGITSAKQVDLRMNNLLPPAGMPGIAHAASRITKAIRNNERIFIAGDYDADGATASALCVSVLRAFGAQQIEFVVPNRFEFGYGLSEAFVDSFSQRKPNLIITVDNGITSFAGVEQANEQGIDVIITDHHLPSKTLPEAYAIVNPALSSSTFGSAPAGVGVAFYLMIEVRSQLRKEQYFEETNITEPNLADWLDLVAIGTVADMVPLDHNNRILVANGLQRMRAGKLRPGVEALCKVANRPIEFLTSTDIGFSLSPHINAAGRLDDISVGIRTLLADDLKEARKHAAKLHAINRERKNIQQENISTAIDVLGEYDSSNFGICVYHPEFHEGVIGLVAGRIVEESNRPTIAFADAAEANGSILKGSARSIEGIHVRDVIADIAARNPYLMQSFGGHAMAAGLTIKKSSLPRFKVLFDNAVKDRAGETAFTSVVQSDGDLSVDEINMEVAQSIEDWGPWGVGFELPEFHGEFDVVAQRSVGAQLNHLKLNLRKEGQVFDSIAFSQNQIEAERVAVTYSLDLNRFRGNTTLQLKVNSIAPVTDVAELMNQ